MSVAKEEKPYVPVRRRVTTPAVFDKGKLRERESVKDLTNSARGVFLNCRKKYQFEYRHLLAPREPNIPFLVGGLFHDGLEAMYKTGRFDAEDAAEIIAKACEKASDECTNGRQSDEVWLQQAVVMGMLRGYAKLYLKSDLKKYKVVEAEKSFSIPLPNGWNYRGKRDLLMKDKANKLVLFEHKSTSWLNASYIAKLPLDSQILGYAWSVGKDKKRLPNRVVYNITKKPSIIQKGTESFNDYKSRVETEYIHFPEKYFYRETVFFSKADIERFRSELVKFAVEMEKAVKSGYYYQNTTHCTQYGKCPFMRLCIDGTTRDNLMSYRIKTSAHEELQEVDGGR